MPVAPTLFFDIGGVVLTNGWDTGTRKRAAETFGLDYPEFQTRHEMLKTAFETISLAKVSTSAAEARSLGLLAPSDMITFNREHVLSDAKQAVIAIAEEGYSAPVPRAQIPVPGEAVLATLKLGVQLMREGEYISDHDVKVANHVVNILCGGNLTPGSLVNEQYFLDLERQAFLSLCGERKTLERIVFTLKTGKPLRN